MEQLVGSGIMHPSTLVITLIVLAVVALLVGPVMMARPSPRDRQLERLRRCAASLGICVELVSLPREARFGDDAMAVARYRLRPSKDTVVTAAPALFRRHAERGFELLRPLTVAGEALAGTLAGEFAQLPKSVQVVEIDARGAAAYWRERGDEQRVAAIGAALERIFECWRRAEPARERR